MTLVDLVVTVHSALARASLGHAFGGALALAYIADPRGTVDVDVNVFLPVEAIQSVLDSLAPLGLRAERPPGEWVPISGVRLRRAPDGYPVDVFPSLDERYAVIEERCVMRPFGPEGELLPFLSAEDLALFKLSFGRDKDWVDLRSIAVAEPDLDVDYIERQLVGLRGPAMYPRIARLRRLVREPAG